jgi:hypothetical protein
MTQIITKYVFVTGGVSSSLGKGIIAASLAKLLQAQGYRVTIQKLDPYINIDPGTLNPAARREAARKPALRCGEERSTVSRPYPAQ